VKVYGVGIRKGGQGKSTTVSYLGRLCAMYGARVLVVDLAQPGTTSESLRDIWMPTDHADLSSILGAFEHLPAGKAPAPKQARGALASAGLPVEMTSQPSWSGGRIFVFPWDDFQAAEAALLPSERVLSGLLATLADDVDIALIDYPAESGPLLFNALMATDSLIIPLSPEAPALEGVDAMLRLLAQIRESGHDVELGGVLLTRCEPKNKRLVDVVQALQRADDVEGESLGRKLFPFAIRQAEFYEQAFRYGVPIWDRTADHANWAGYVLLAEWLLRDAGMAGRARARRGPALLPPETPILDVTALMLSDPEIPVADFERAHVASQRQG
jgi:chromosome partitioning protein